MINILILMNAKENFELVKELKKRGLFKEVEEQEQKKIIQEMYKLKEKQTEEIENEGKRLREENIELKEKQDELIKNFYAYLFIAKTIGYIDRNEYFEKRNFNLSNENIKELDTLCSTILNHLYSDFKVKDIKKLNFSDILDYSAKYLEKNYKTKTNIKSIEEESEEEEPVEGIKYY